MYPAVLCKILKSAYGLSEVPRPHTGELLRKCGFDEILWAPVTLIKRRSGKVVAILCLHVDDGFLGGQKGREMEEAKKDITALFSMKEWQVVDRKPGATGNEYLLTSVMASFIMT